MLTQQDTELITKIIRQLLDPIRKNMASKDDLKGMASKEDLERMASKEDLERMASKEDLRALESRLQQSISDSQKDTIEVLSELIHTGYGLHDKRITKLEDQVHHLSKAS